MSNIVNQAASSFPATFLRHLALALSAPFAVAAVILVPVLVDIDAVLLEQHLFPRLNAGLERLTPTQMGLFFLGGVLLGYMAPPLRPAYTMLFSAITAFLGVAWLPLATFLELGAYPSANSLWPFALLFYCFYGLLLFGGLLLGRGLACLSPWSSAA